MDVTPTRGSGSRAGDHSGFRACDLKHAHLCREGMQKWSFVEFSQGKKKKKRIFSSPYTGFTQTFESTRRIKVGGFGAQCDLRGVRVTDGSGHAPETKQLEMVLGEGLK